MTCTYPDGCTTTVTTQPSAPVPPAATPDSGGLPITGADGIGIAVIVGCAAIVIGRLLGRANRRHAERDGGWHAQR